MKRNNIVNLDETETVLYLFNSGICNAINGERDYGKTFYCVNAMGKLEDLRFKIFTNVIFLMKAGHKIDCPNCEGNGEIYYYKGQKKIYTECEGCKGQGKIDVFKEKYPENIIKITTIYDMFKTASEIHVKNRFQKISNWWDEIQNTAHSHKWRNEISFTLMALLGTARKWRMNHNFITPLFSSIPAMIRRDVKFRFYKSEGLTRYFNNALKEKWNLKKGLIFAHVVRIGTNNELIMPKEIDNYLPLEPRFGKYNKGPERAGKGDIFYDHEASAALDVGPEEFNIEAFAKVFSDMPRQDIPGQSLAWFEDFEAEGGKDKKEDKIEFTPAGVSVWIRGRVGEHVLLKVEGKRGLCNVKMTASNLAKLTKGKQPTIHKHIVEYFEDSYNV